jgi:hypothetical protein
MRIIGMIRGFIQNHGNGIIGVSVLDHKIHKSDLFFGWWTYYEGFSGAYFLVIFLSELFVFFEIFELFQTTKSSGLTNCKFLENV